jgi:DNA-binding IclR family transcriptional regulator
MIANGDSPHKVPNLDRGLSVFELLSRHDNGLTASEISHCLAIPRNSMSRILATMEDRGYLNRDHKTKKFTLTQKLLSLGTSIVSDSNIIEKSIDLMKSLRDTVTETIMLTTILNGEGVVLEQVASTQPIRLMIDPGTRFELHNSAPGKTHIAYMPEKQRNKLLEEIELSAATGSTITDRNLFRKEITEIQTRGWGTDRCECLDGVHCVSAPIFDRNGYCIATLTVTGPSTRLKEESFESIASILTEHSKKVSRRLGWEAPL